MELLKSNLSVAKNKECSLKSKCIGLGTGQIEQALETNITGVRGMTSVYQDCSNILKQYKNLLDKDAAHIKDLGVYFFEVDHQMAGKK